VEFSVIGQGAVIYVADCSVTEEGAVVMKRIVV